MRATAKPRPRVILVCDDDPSLRRLFVLALEDMGYRLVEAADGGQALELARRHADELALVLLDNLMPRCTGIEVLAELRQQEPTRHVPVLFVTGVADVAERVQALDAGAHDYIVKPIHLDELRARVRSHLRRHETWLGETDRLQRRADAAAALCQIPPDDSPEAAAAAVLKELAGLHDPIELSLHIFLHDGLTLCLAEHHHDGTTLRGGTPLTQPEAAEVRRRAGAGPWLDPEVAQAKPGGLALVTATASAWVPLQDRITGDLQGVLVARATDAQTFGDPATRITAVLATALDFSAVVDTVLVPLLARLNATHERHERMTRLLSSPFRPVFQPIISLQGDDEIAGYEALTRFADGTRPDVRLAEAASVGGQASLEAVLMQQAIRESAALPAESWLSLNVSPGLLLDEATLESLLLQASRPIVLELTEQERVDDYDAVRRALEHLALDVRLAVDDAGAGYASLRHIVDLRPAFIKLDRSWVAGIDHDLARQALVAGLHHFSERTGCALIAEGIEHPAELEMLRTLDVELGQGFLLGRPTPLDD